MNVQKPLKRLTLPTILQIAAITVILWIGYDAVTENRPLPDVPTLMTDGFSIEVIGIEPALTFTEAEWLDDDGNHILEFRNPAENDLIQIQFYGLPDSCEFAQSPVNESQCSLHIRLDGTEYHPTGVGFLELDPLHYTSLFIGQIGINVITLSGELNAVATSPENMEIHVQGSFEELVQPG